MGSAVGQYYRDTSILSGLFSQTWRIWIFPLALWFYRNRKFTCAYPHNFIRSFVLFPRSFRLRRFRQFRSSVADTGRRFTRNRLGAHQRYHFTYICPHALDGACRWNSLFYKLDGKQFPLVFGNNLFSVRSDLARIGGNCLLGVLFTANMVGISIVIRNPHPPWPVVCIQQRLI